MTNNIQPIFLGNDNALRERGKLHALLDVALDVLGGIQQPTMSTEKPTEQISREHLETLVVYLVSKLDCENLLTEKRKK